MLSVKARPKAPSTTLSRITHEKGIIMDKLTWGVVGTSKKADEERVPIHPDHLLRIAPEYRKQLIFEEGYGSRFGVSDDEISALTGGIAPRHQLLEDIGNVIIAKPTLADLEDIRIGGNLWGYPHCAQQRAITQAAIDRKLTLIAFEDMFVWNSAGQMGRHTFYKNNELAGYCAVLHALSLKGIDGHYGNQRKVTIFGFGAVSRGAIYALKAHGFRDITIYIQRPDNEVREEVLDCHYSRVRNGGIGEPRMLAVAHDGCERNLIDIIAESDIIINGKFQNPDHPINFVVEEEKDCLKRNSLIIDVSCDEGMGFYFAKPTTFKNPMFKVGKTDYYAVDHTPSYLWESASRSISAALIVHLPVMIEGRASWEKNDTISRAVNLDAGVIVKPNILSFQKRQSDYPHATIS